MADALTTAQLDVLRRLRDGDELAGEPFVPNPRNELVFLRPFRRVEVRGHLEVLLTDAGRHDLLAGRSQGAAASGGRSSW